MNACRVTSRGGTSRSPRCLKCSRCKLRTPPTWSLGKKNGTFSNSPLRGEASSVRCSSEVELQPELNFPRITRPTRPEPENRLNGAVHLPERSGIRDVVIRIGEVGVVEGIKELHAKLEALALRYRELPEEAQIQVPKPGSVEGARCAAPERAVGRDREGRWVDKETGSRANITAGTRGRVRRA